MSQSKALKRAKELLKTILDKTDSKSSNKTLVPLLQQPLEHLENPFQQVQSNFDFSCWVNVHEVVGYRLKEMGFFEPFETLLVSKLLKPGHCFFDIGANFGYYSLLAAKCCQASVVAFEPIPSLFQLLKRNIGENGFDSIIQANQLAISDKKGISEFYLSHDSAASSLAKDQDDSLRRWSQVATIKVETATLDDWVRSNNVTAIDFIKVDVEGFEPFVFKGAEKSIVDFKPIILAELHPSHLSRSGFRVGDIIDMFAEMGYLGFDIADYGCRRIDAKAEKSSANMLFIQRDDSAIATIEALTLLDTLEVLNESQLISTSQYLETLCGE